MVGGFVILVVVEFILIDGGGDGGIGFGVGFGYEFLEIVVVFVGV